MQIQICPHCKTENEIVVAESEKTWRYVGYIEAETHTYEYSGEWVSSEMNDVSFGCRSCGKSVNMEEIITKEVEEGPPHDAATSTGMYDLDEV